MRTDDLEIGKRYEWRGLKVTLRHLEGTTATVAPVGSTAIAFAESSELAPLARKSQLAAPTMQVTDADWQRAVELERALREVPNARNKADAMRIVAHGFKISVRTAYNYAKRLLHNPSPHALLRANPGRRLGSRVLDDKRDAIIRDRIENAYLQPERATIPQVHGHIKIACERAGLPPPCLNTVRARVNAIDLEERIKRREGRKRANEVCKPVPAHLNVLRPLERIEVDHTLVDVILVSDTQPRVVLGRPWLTLAIDCFTRMVAGFYVSFDRPSSVSVAMALAHSFLPKEEWLRRHGVPGIWSVFGFPEAIWVDNALEFRAIALRRGCEAYRIKLCYRPPGEPQVGGTIERLIGTTMGEVHLLPGTTHSNVQKRGDYDAEAHATLTLREFTTWLTTMIVTKYHTSTHRGIGKPPLVAWNQALGDVTRLPPGAPLEVLAHFLPGTTRVLRRVGIELHGLKYWSDAFTPWIGQKLKVTVHDYPLDLDHIYVRLPNGEITVASVSNPKAVANKTVTDHLMQAAHDRSLQDDDALKQMRHDGHDRAQEVLTGARTAKRAKSAPKRATEPAVVKPSIQLYRPNKNTVVSIHFDNGGLQ